MNQDQRDLIILCLGQMESNIKTIRRVMRDIQEANQ